MATFLISVLVIALVMAGMAVGVLTGRKPIKGSCGGLGALGIDASCEICGGDPKRCDEETRDGEVGRSQPGLYYPANDQDKQT
jgi:hypothetical protein